MLKIDSCRRISEITALAEYPGGHFRGGAAGRPGGGNRLHAVNKLSQFCAMIIAG